MASSRAKLDADQGDRWDSGKVVSDRSTNVAYAGGALASGERCWWKAKVWPALSAVEGPALSGVEGPALSGVEGPALSAVEGPALSRVEGPALSRVEGPALSSVEGDRDGAGSDWSAPASFEMGLLQASDWEGQWIAAASGLSAPLLRKGFSINKTVKRARLYVCGLGWHELYLDGAKVGDRELDPAPTWFDNVLPFPLGSRCLYVTHDVTDRLQPGTHALGVMLGHGWYSSDTKSPVGRRPFADRPVLLVQMNIEFDDRSTLSIVSDGSWRTSPGPITANDLAMGEHYDARREQPGWDSPGFDDGAWAPAEIARAPSGRLVAQSVEPERVTHRFPATRTLRSGEGSVIFDVGQFISGWVELRVSGPKGTRLTLRHAGRVNYETASLDTRNNTWGGGVTQTDSYTLKGEGVEVWHPRFTVHGFRYVEVSGYPGDPPLDAVTGCAVNSDVPTAGRFECSNDLLNRIHHNVYWTFLGSFQGIPQDAADRAERVAWLGDPGFVAEDYMLNFRDARFWEKWLDDIRDSQKENGDVPFVSPPYWFGYSDWPCWECCYALFVWHGYRYNDDVPLLANHYGALKKQADRFHARAEDGILAEPLGDHMEPSGEGGSLFNPRLTPTNLTGTAYYYFTTRIAAEAAAVLGRHEDAAGFAARAEGIKAAFNRTFFNPQTNTYATGSQTSQALPLYLRLVPEGHEAGVLENLVAEIARHHGHLMTGIIGTDALAQALPAFGRADVLHGIATQTSFPGWGYGVALGQTTLSEDFECSSQRSVSMKMFGSIEKYLYRDVAGLSMSGPGYRRIEIRPKVCGQLDWARASIGTVRGPAAVEWRRTSNGLTMSVTIPVNATADVHLPKLGLNDARVSEGGAALWASGAMAGRVPGVTGGSESDGSVVLNVGSGSYAFELTGRA